MCQDKAKYSPKIESCLMENGKLQSYAFPGGYPLFYVTADNSVLCPECSNQSDVDYNDRDDKQWNIVAADVNYEDDSLFCDHCSKVIESAYGDPDSED